MMAMKRRDLAGRSPRRLPPLIACVWRCWLDCCGVARRAQLFAINGLPPAMRRLRELPAILGDREALLNILDSVRRMAIGFALALAVAVPSG